MLNKLSRKDIELLNILAQTPEGESALNEYIKQHEKAVKAYKVYRESVVAEVEVPKVEKSANELRAEVIQRAKEFVGRDSDVHTVKRGRHYTGTSVEFVVNGNKRTVEVLIRNSSGRLLAEGIAKCNPDDVFNADIGKAIALGRTLGKDVSEFESAVQPNFEIGQIVEYVSTHAGETSVIQITQVDSRGLWFVNTFGTEMCLDPGVSKIKFVNDTDAIYKEGVE